jgi:hypothetical protein
LSGSERELDDLSSHPTNVEMVSQSIKVYDLTSWPNLKPVPGTVTLVETTFDIEEEDQDVIDVDPA